MNGDALVEIHFRGIETDETLRELLEKRCAALAQEFPETSRFELTLSSENTEIDAHGHVLGKDTDEASHAMAPDARRAGERALDKLERELRRHHDKKIFAHRREAQKSSRKRT